MISLPRLTLFLSLLLCLAAPVFAGTASFEEFDKKAKTDARLNIVFLGASLTWGANATNPLLTSARADLARQFEEQYPKAHFTFWDASIGGTGSNLGLFRVDRDVMAHHPDLVFIDFTSNDGIWAADPIRCASYEACVRRVIDEAHAPVVQMIFPFEGDAAKLSLETFKLRDAHYAISKAYHTGMGDAMELIQGLLRDKKVTLEQIWPHDGVHPGDFGYTLFTQAVWDGYLKAVNEKLVCSTPEKMLHADTFMHSVRPQLATLTPLPAGWTAGVPNLTSAYFDMLMSRWLDSEAIACNRKDELINGHKQKVPQEVSPLRASIHGQYVLLYGESTMKTGKIKVIIDGNAKEYNPGGLAKAASGNAHFNLEVATNLNPDADHVIEIVPEFSSDKEEEFRIESICVAGDKPSVKLLETPTTQATTAPSK